MKARKHREMFIDSMETMKEIPATIEAVAEYFDVPKDSLTFTKSSFDARLGWEAGTWLVSSKNSVVGMISEEVKHDLC